MFKLPFNIFATLYFNFKYLPFKQAIHLPIVFYNRISFQRNRGRVVLESNVPSFKMVQIGAHGSDMFPNETTTIDVEGTLLFRGSNIIVGTGSLIRVEKNAEIEFFEHSIIGARNMVFACKSIQFMQNTLFSWDCQILDSDTHQLKDMITGEIKPYIKNIVIGKDSWIGNHVIINKGTVLPAGTVVSAMSLCNKDYSAIIDSNCVIGGVPAKLLCNNIKRVSIDQVSFLE